MAQSFIHTHLNYEELSSNVIRGELVFFCAEYAFIGLDCSPLELMYDVKFIELAI